MRIFCLSSITRIPSSKSNVKVVPYENDADELLLTGEEEEITSYNFQNSSDDPQYYRLTEISCGYKFVEDKKVFVMNFYREDTGLLSFRMTRGAIRFVRVKPKVFDLFVATSKLYPAEMEEDLRIRIRWIKNTTTEIISDEEKEMYNFGVFEIENCSVSETLERNFDDYPFELPNLETPKVLEQKINDFSTLIYLLCDPASGNYKNVNPDSRIHQKVESASKQETSTSSSKTEPDNGKGSKSKILTSFKRLFKH